MRTGKVPGSRARTAVGGAGFLFAGERLAVDFVNTRIAEAGRRVELLDSPRGLEAWAEAAGILSGRELVRDFRGRSAQAEMRRVRAFREALRRGLLRWRESGRAPSGLVSLLNRRLAADPGYPVLVRAGAKVSARRRSTGRPLDRLLAAIARSAAGMLEADDPKRFRKCANPECVLCFYDVSKAGRRRWHSMSTCGSRAKVRAYYRRQRGKR